MGVKKNRYVGKMTSGGLYIKLRVCRRRGEYYVAIEASKRVYWSVFSTFGEYMECIDLLYTNFYVGSFKVAKYVRIAPALRGGSLVEFVEHHTRVPYRC
jgi:hypothetical protein